MRRLTDMLAALATAMLAVPAAAYGKPLSVIAPPGDSAISQYVEVVPTDTGATLSRSGVGYARVLTPDELQTLDGLGPAGRTLAAVVDQTSPPIRTSRPELRRALTSGAVGDPRARSGVVDPLAGVHPRSTMSLILDTATGGADGVLGVLVPAIVLAAALGIVAGAVLRRRTGP
jgi:hypothetical protein